MLANFDHSLPIQGLSAQAGACVVVAKKSKKQSLI